jgi:hypothetical protein
MRFDVTVTKFGNIHRNKIIWDNSNSESYTKEYFVLVIFCPKFAQLPQAVKR